MKPSQETDEVEMSNEWEQSQARLGFAERGDIDHRNDDNKLVL